MSAIDDLIKDANSILNTLDKDYEAMQSQKSNVRQEQVDAFDDLCGNMKSILGRYSKTIMDLRNKLGSGHDSCGDELTVYEFPCGSKLLVIIPVIYWAGNNKLTFKLKVLEKPKDREGYYNCEYIAVTETDIDIITSGFDAKGYSDTVSVFLNHCPSYGQLDTAFQTALTDFIKFCVTSIQNRNERLADKIKSITM